LETADDFRVTQFGNNDTSNRENSHLCSEVCGFIPPTISPTDEEWRS